MEISDLLFLPKFFFFFFGYAERYFITLASPDEMEHTSIDDCFDGRENRPFSDDEFAESASAVDDRRFGIGGGVRFLTGTDSFGGTNTSFSNEPSQNIIKDK